MKKIKIHGTSVPSETHTLITGAPGMGKTRSILRPLLKEYLSRDAEKPDSKTGLLLLDPKGDMLEWTEELLASIGRANDLVIIGEGHSGFNLFSALPQSTMQYASRLSTLSNSLNRVTEFRSDSEYWVSQQRQILEALIEVARRQRRGQQIQIADVVSLRFNFLPKLKGSFEQMANQFHLDELGDVKRVLKDFSNLPHDTRECVLSTVANCLSVFHQEPLRELMNPSADKGIDLIDIIEQGKCVVVSCASRSFGDATLPLLQAVKEAFADFVLCRSEIEIETENGFRKLNPNREVLYVADEAHRILKRGDDGGELDFIDTSREFRCRAILATQSISSFQSVLGVVAANRLIALFGNHFFLNNIDPASCEWAHQMFGRPEDVASPPPLLIPGLARSNFIDWTGPQTLSQLRVGEFLLRTNEGKTYRKRASWHRVAGKPHLQMA